MIKYEELVMISIGITVILGAIIICLKKRISVVLKISREKQIFLKIQNNMFLYFQFNKNFDFLHDLLNECRELNDNLDHQDYEQLKINLYHLYNETFKKFNTLYISSPILYFIINMLSKEINEYNINIKTVIENQEMNFMKLDDQYKFFSILLENAIKANKYVITEARLIILKANKIGNQMIVQIIYKMEPLYYDNEKYINNLHCILKKYNAIIYDDYKEAEKLNKITVMFPL